MKRDMVRWGSRRTFLRSERGRGGERREGGNFMFLIFILLQNTFYIFNEEVIRDVTIRYIFSLLFL